MSREAFSFRLRRELLALLEKDKSYWPLGFSVMATAALRFSGRELRLATRHEAFAKFSQKQCEYLYHFRPEIRGGKGQYSLCVREREPSTRIRADLQLFRQQGAAALDLRDGSPNRQEKLQVVLAELFLSCGSLSRPEESYGLDFSLIRQSSAELFSGLFAEMEMTARSIRHQGYYVLYIKDGQKISDFLLYSGAHKSLLSFEELRVEKELSNQVNRVVNCDSANAQRLADSSAQQRQAIRLIDKAYGLEKLPPDLLEAAEARLKCPEFSLAELGAKMDPPLGKSGMNHRLKRLMRLAEELEAEQGAQSGSHA